MSVDVPGILAELARFRQRRGNDADVALMTLVAFFEDARVGTWLRDRLHSLAVKDPARVVLLDGTHDGPDRCIAECGEHADCLKTRGEWIEIGVGDCNADTLESAMTALSLPQAPIVLVWGSTRIASDPRFARAAAVAEVVVYNSSVLVDGNDGLSQLVEFVRDHPATALRDLAYMRLAPWQDCVALFFDGKDVIHELFDLRRVEIASGSLPEAYYLLGWLASRLEWRTCGPHRFCNRFGTEITCEIDDAGLPRRIRRVALHSPATSFVAELERDGHGAIALTVSGAREQPARVHAIANVDTAALIERALLDPHPDRVFVDSLTAAGDVLARAARA